MAAILQQKGSGHQGPLYGSFAGKALYAAQTQKFRLREREQRFRLTEKRKC